MDEEFNFDPISIERFRRQLEKQFNTIEEQSKKVAANTHSINVVGVAQYGKSTFLNALLQSYTIVDLPGQNNSVNNAEDETSIKHLLKTYYEVKNLRKESQDIDKKINTFLKPVKVYVKASQENDIQSYPIIIFNCCHNDFNNDYSYSELEISMLLELQERNRKLLAYLTKLETTLQAVMIMWLVTNTKQIPSFVVYLICNLNMNVVEWLRSGLGEEMMGDLTERHHELKEEHPNSDILVSFILLGTALQMIWSVLLIKLNDLMSDEEIEFCF